MSGNFITFTKPKRDIDNFKEKDFEWETVDYFIYKKLGQLFSKSKYSFKLVFRKEIFEFLIIMYYDEKFKKMIKNNEPYPVKENILINFDSQLMVRFKYDELKKQYENIFESKLSIEDIYKIFCKIFHYQNSWILIKKDIWNNYFNILYSTLCLLHCYLSVINIRVIFTNDFIMWCTSYKRIYNFKNEKDSKLFNYSIYRLLEIIPEKYELPIDLIKEAFQSLSKLIHDK